MMRMHVREVHLAVRGRGKWFPHCASDGPVAANTLCYSFVLVYLYSCICLLCIFIIVFVLVYLYKGVLLMDLWPPMLFAINHKGFVFNNHLFP